MEIASTDESDAVSQVAFANLLLGSRPYYTGTRNVRAEAKSRKGIQKNQHPNFDGLPEHELGNQKPVCGTYLS